MLTIEVISTYTSVFVQVYQSKCVLALCPAWAVLFLLYHFTMEPPFMCDFSSCSLELCADSLMVLCLCLS